MSEKVCVYVRWSVFRQKEKESEVCVTAKPDPLVTGAEASSQMTGSHTLPSVLSGSHTLLAMAAALRCLPVDVGESTNSALNA